MRRSLTPTDHTVHIRRHPVRTGPRNRKAPLPIPLRLRHISPLLVQQEGQTDSAIRAGLPVILFDGCSVGWSLRHGGVVWLLSGNNSSGRSGLCTRRGSILNDGGGLFGRTGTVTSGDEGVEDSDVSKSKRESIRRLSVHVIPT